MDPKNARLIKRIEKAALASKATGLYAKVNPNHLLILVGLARKTDKLEQALKPFADCWVSPEPKYPLEDDYYFAAKELGLLEYPKD
jgi:hypothetical protein